MPENQYLQWADLYACWLRLSDDQRKAFATLADAVERIGPRALRVLCIQADRLREGAVKYADENGGGDFDQQRDYTRECLEEFLDASNYMSCALIGMQDFEKSEMRETIPSPPPEAAE